MTFVAEPADGYDIESIIVKNMTTGEETVLDNSRSDEFNFIMPASDVLVTANFSQHTGISRVENSAQVIGVVYINLAGMSSDKPFNGVNIVKTTYNDGSVVVSKVVR